MAQGYQDITGQIIRSVIALVDELEKSARQAGADCRRQRSHEPGARPAGAAGLGAWPGAAGRRNCNGDAVSGQDDIDALLSQMAAGK